MKDWFLETLEVKITVCSIITPQSKIRNCNNLSAEENLTPDNSVRRTVFEFQATAIGWKTSAKTLKHAADRLYAIYEGANRRSSDWEEMPANVEVFHPDLQLSHQSKMLVLDKGLMVFSLLNRIRQQTRRGFCLLAPLVGLAFRQPDGFSLWRRIPDLFSESP